MPDKEFGSDGQVHDVDVPSAAPAAKPSDPPPSADPFEASEPGSAAQRLRDFEDEHLGEDAPRFGGKLEKGHGSLFQRMSPEQQKAHAAIEKSAETEQKVADARAALAVAESEHNAALAAAEDASRLGSG
jgi:hypothetical protein